MYYEIRGSCKKNFQINYGDEKINPLLRNVVKWSDAL